MKSTIESIKETGITFNYISEEKANTIMKSEFSPRMLLCYSSLFDKYKKTLSAGRFINLDFAYLYELALLDCELRKIVMEMCLDIERCLKVFLIDDCEQLGCKDSIVADYCETDFDFLNANYKNNYLDHYAKQIIGSSSVSELQLDDFLEIVQFGTFQRLLIFFYSKYSNKTEAHDRLSLLSNLDSVRSLRNAAAHNNALLSHLNYEVSEDFHKNYALVSFLGNHGIKSRTLETNTKKQLLHDFACLVNMYSKIETNHKEKNCLYSLLSFFENRCTINASFFNQNPTIMSAYKFCCDVIKIHIDVFLRHH